jgi:hypothetical protein
MKAFYGFLRELTQDGAVDISDGKAIFDYLFQNGAAPAGSFPAAGPDPDMNDQSLACPVQVVSEK